MGQPSASWNWFSDLYRFAMILTLDATQASEVTRGALDEALKNRHGHWDQERGHILLFRSVRTRCLKVNKARADAIPPKGELPQDAAASVAVDADVAKALHHVPEPGRSAFALLLLDALDAEAVCKLLGMGIAELSNTVQSARLEVHRSLSNRTPRNPSEAGS